MEPNNTDYTGVDPHTKMNKILESLHETLIFCMSRLSDVGSNNVLNEFLVEILPIVQDLKSQVMKATTAFAPEQNIAQAGVTAEQVSSQPKDKVDN